MPRSFTDELRDLRQGDLVHDLTSKLAELVLAVTDRGKPGKLTLELAVRQVSGGVVAITDKVSLKLPVGRAAETLMFASPEGSLLVDNPRQNKLDLKVAPDHSEAGELKSPAAA